MSVFVDYLTELALDTGKDFLIDKKKDQQLKARIEDYIKRQENINELSSLSEEIDFHEISDYISSELLKDVKVYMFGKKINRYKMKDTIMSKACNYAALNKDISQNKVSKLVSDSLDIIRNFYREQISENDLFMASEIVDTLEEDITIQKDIAVKQICEAIEEGNTKVLDEVKELRSEKSFKRKNENGLNYEENTMFKSIHDFVMQNYIKERYRNFNFNDNIIDKYSDLFKAFVKTLKNDNEIHIDKNIFEFIKDELLVARNNNLIKISGPDGTGKSTFLSILYIYLYNYCLKNGFKFYPFYINLHFYDGIISDTYPNEEDVKTVMDKDLENLKKIIDQFPNMYFVIIIDGNENYFRTTLKTSKYFNEFLKQINGHKKIVCIGEKTNVHTYRERTIYSYMNVRMLYTFRFQPIQNFEEEKRARFIDFFGEIEENGDLLNSINTYSIKFDLDEVDLNILSVYKKCYDSDLVSGLKSISDLYKNYCMDYLDFEINDFEISAKMSYEYFMTNRKFTQKEIADKNKEWNLIHQHKSISNFLIAYYFVEKVKTYSEGSSTKELECLFSKDINVFIKPLINESLEIQKLILQKCKKIYECGGILARSQTLYMIGRIKNKNIENDTRHILEKYYKEISEQLSDKTTYNKTQEERSIRFLLRSVIISLIYLGDKDKREIYLEMLLNNPVANKVNRGFHLEYFGDIPRVPDSAIYDYNDDGSEEMYCTYNILLNRVKKYLSSSHGKEDFNFQINLLTLCSLVQARLGKSKLSNEYVNDLRDILNKTLLREQNNLNKDFKSYLTMLKEDIEENTFSPRFLYNKLYGVKNIIRSGWKNEIVNGTIKEPYENVVEHIYYTWMLGVIFLPDETPTEKEYTLYSKEKILDTILIHDWAEIDVGDIVPEEDSDKKRELEDFRMRILLMHDTYSNVGNMMQYKKMWKVYGKNSLDINGKIAYELDKIQALYQFYLYVSHGAKFTDEKMKSWLSEKNKITTSIGKKILNEAVIKNFDS